LKYAWDVVRETIISKMQDIGLFYERKYDGVSPEEGSSHYVPKTDFESPHTLTLDRIPSGCRVLDIGCAGGYVGEDLVARGCKVTGIDNFPASNPNVLTEFIRHDLDDPDLPVDLANFDWLLLLDVIEHLKSPEQFVARLRDGAAFAKDPRLIISTGNVGFGITRLMLLLGSFNYGKRGILDLTHTRLFTFGSIRKLLEQARYQIVEIRGVPAPIPLAIGHNWVSRLLMFINQSCIRLWKSFFSYQIYIVARPLPTLERLLLDATTVGKNTSAIEAPPPNTTP